MAAAHPETPMNFPSRPFCAFPLVLAVGLSGCAGAGPGASFSERDPYEDTNRDIHAFNVALDRNLLRPVAQGYGLVTPTLFKHMLGNLFNQFETLNHVFNYTFQGEAEPALTAFGRLGVNTILGAGGTLDPATEFGLPQQDTDFGVTLGKHGVEEGAFLMLPFFGPSTTRDLGGLAGDMALDPLTYTGFSASDTLNIFSPVYSAAEIVHTRDANAAIIDDLLYESPDSYVSLRSVYLQRRDKKILGEDAGAESMPDIFDEPAE